ncbi:DUF6415 family natural product biosynthesis protein [Streptomyces sp. NPDC087219]|uniref:DUF6415 family natural product biosynthesis protein n=1 Tax=Streptomyces sp. NPDC087219 TaxID=3365770 RepID=UPI0037F3714A
MCLFKAVLAWTGEDTLATRGLEQIALRLTGHARALAAGVRRRAGRLAKGSGPWALADVVVREAEGRLSAAREGTVRCVQVRAASFALSVNGWTALGPRSPRRGLFRAGAEPCGLVGGFQVLRRRVECLPGLTRQVADLAQSIFLGVGGLVDRSGGGGLARLPPRIPCCSAGCHIGCGAPHRR